MKTSQGHVAMETDAPARWLAVALIYAAERPELSYDLQGALQGCAVEERRVAACRCKLSLSPCLSYRVI